MKTYRVRTTPRVDLDIFDHFAYIAVTQRQPQNASDWLDRIEAAAKSLDQMPTGCALAEENDAKAYEVRKRGVDGFNLLFTIIEDRDEVWVFGTRAKGMRVLADRHPDTLNQIEAQLRGGEQDVENAE